MSRSGRRIASVGALVVLTAASLGVVFAAPASAATPVADEASFRTAFATSTDEVDLTDDIILTCQEGPAVASRNSSSNLVVDGGGHTIEQDCPDNGVLSKTGTGTLTLQNVTITGGSATNGGGVFSSGAALTLTNVTVTGNVASSQGGGVAVVAGPVTINGSTFTQNTCDACEGAAIYNGNAPANLITISDSSITGNTGGSIVLGDNGVTLNNTVVANNEGDGVLAGQSILIGLSTISNNTGIGAGSEAGAITIDHSTIDGNAGAASSSGPLTVDHSTISNNSQSNTFTATLQSNQVHINDSTVTQNASPRGAIQGNSSVSLFLATVVDNTVVSVPAAGFGSPSPQVQVAGPAANVNTSELLTAFGSVVALPHGGPNCNRPASFGPQYDYDTDNSCGFNDVNTDTSGGPDPQLGALTNNGGPTQTRMPVTGSPLIDRIVPSDCEQQQQQFAGFALIPAQGTPFDDQRDVVRPIGPACDIGAVEANPAASSVVTVIALPPSAFEGGTDGGFQFQRTGDTTSPLTVGYSASGTATSGTDYTPLIAVTIPAGQSQVTIPVHALADNVADDGETVTVAISPGSGYTPGTPNQATVTIHDHGFCDTAPEADYNDRELFDVHARAIDCITAYGMAVGFTDGSYGPTLPVSRAQMASFLTRLMDAAGVSLPSSPPDAFPGDDGDVHELAINQLAALGVLDDTTGQTGDQYNVSDPMRRDDMAQLLVNAWTVIVGEPLPEGPNAFTDDESSDNEAAINALAAAGVVQGTGGGLYNPNGSVSRGQMASLFVRYMQLLVDAGKLAPLP